jgi:hypothetical protein
MQLIAPFIAAYSSLIRQMMGLFSLFCCRMRAEQALLRHQFSLGIVNPTLLRLSAGVHRFPSSMPRIRGRSRRGSAWKPRRPSRSRPSSSPSSISLCSRSSRSSSEHSFSTAQSMESAHSPSWALVPFAASRPPSNSSMPPLHSEPSPHQTSRGAGPLPRGASTPAQLWDSLAVLYDLVFGIRHSLDDLNFRLQKADDKIDLFLSTLASLQDSLSQRQSEDSPVQDPRAPQEHSALDAQIEIDKGATSGSRAVNTVAEGGGDINWADQVASIEEEPLTDDIQTIRPDYSPYV